MRGDRHHSEVDRSNATGPTGPPVPLASPPVRGRDGRPARAARARRGSPDDIGGGGGAAAPRRRLVFDADIPRQPESLPRALPPDVDAAVMAAVGGLDDRFARVGITVLRHTGLRIGELL